MQAASAALTAALASKERTLVLRVKADWARDGTYAYDPGLFSDIFSDTFAGAGDMGDLTSLVTSVSVTRQLTTDLPDSVRLDTGAGAAQATVTLSGTLSSGTLISRALTAHGGTGSVLRRVNTPVYVEIGAVGTSGAEYVRQFTGRVRSLSIDPFDGSVTVTALDGREKLRAMITLPILVGTLNAGYFLDYIATANGITGVFEASQNAMTATPILDGSNDSWEMLQQIADAEQGIILFDENDVLRFYDRTHMVGSGAVATITTDTSTFGNLKAITSEEVVDSVRNYVTVTASPLSLDGVGTTIWALAEQLGVPANGTIIIPIEFPGPAYSIASFDYRAAKLPDGTGGDISNLILAVGQVTQTTWNMQVDNPNAFDAYVVGNSTTPTVAGQPYLKVIGQCLRLAAQSGYASIRNDPNSQTRYGTQPLDVPASPWRQSRTAADSLADYLLKGLAEPRPTLSGVSIVGNPLLQLADRVRVTEPDGLSLDEEFWVVGLTTEMSAGAGLSQSVTLRQMDPTAAATTMVSTLTVGTVSAGEKALVVSPLLAPAVTPRGVMFVHGYGSDAEYCLATYGRQDQLTKAVVGAGFTGFSGDYGGTSTWGNATAMARMTSAYNYVQTLSGVAAGKVALISGSMGGQTSFNWAAANPTLVSCIVSVIPVVNPSDIVTNNRLGYAAAINAAYSGGWSEATYGATYNPRTRATAGALNNIPMLLFYGTTDQLCVPAQTQGLATSVGASCQLVPLSTGHEEASYTAADHPRIVAFLKAYAY